MGRKGLDITFLCRTRGGFWIMGGTVFFSVGSLTAGVHLAAGCEGLWGKPQTLVEPCSSDGVHRGLVKLAWSGRALRRPPVDVSNPVCLCVVWGACTLGGRIGLQTGPLALLCHVSLLTRIFKKK
eukprot:RCo036852